MALWCKWFEQRLFDAVAPSHFELRRFCLSPRPPLLTTVRLSSGEGEIKGVSPSPKVSFFHFGRGGRGRGKGNKRVLRHCGETTSSLLPQFVVVFLGRGSASNVILSEGEGSRSCRVETLRFRSRRARRVVAAASQASAGVRVIRRRKTIAHFTARNCVRVIL